MPSITALFHRECVPSLTFEDMQKKAKQETWYRQLIYAIFKHNFSPKHLNILTLSHALELTVSFCCPYYNHALVF